MNLYVTDKLKDLLQAVKDAKTDDAKKKAHEALGAYVADFYDLHVWSQEDFG